MIYTILFVFDVYLKPYLTSLCKEDITGCECRVLRCSSAGLVGTTSPFTTHSTHQLPRRLSLETFVIISRQVRKVTFFSMDQMSKMQVVAKKMEKMLETSLQQLKSEQNLNG